MDVTERKIPTLKDRSTEGTRHKLTLDVTGCEDAAKTYLENMGIQYTIEEQRHTAIFTLDTENQSEKAILDQLISDAGVGKKIAGYGIIRALAFPLEFHDEVEEAEFTKIAAASKVRIGGKKKKEVGLWVGEYFIPVLLAFIIGIGYAGLATHQRNLDLYTPATVEQLRSDWYQQYHSTSGMDAWLNPPTNKFTLSFPVDSIISEAKNFTLIKIEQDTILVVGSPDNADGIWYPEQKQFVGKDEEIVEFLHPDSFDVEEYAANIIDPMTIDYRRIDGDIRARFEEGRDKKSVQLSGTVVIDTTKGDIYMPTMRGKIKLLAANDLQRLYLNVAGEVTVMGKMRFYQWINENDASRSRRDTQIVGEFDIEVLKLWGRYM